jgi:solute carrier family 35 protein
MAAAPAKSAQAGRPSLLRSMVPALTAVLYVTVSTLAVVLNKFIFAKYKFNFPVTFIFAQIVFAVVAIEGGRLLGLLKIERPSLAVYRRFVPVALVFLCNGILGVAGLRYMEAGLFSVLRRLTVMTTIVLELLLLRLTHSKLVYFSVAVMLAGSGMAMSGDLRANPIGYALVLLNNLASSIYGVVTLKVARGAGLSSLQSMLVVNTINLPCCAALVYYLEAEGLRAYPHFSDQAFNAILFISAGWIFLLNFSSLLCTRHNSPLTTDIAGQSKNVWLVLYDVIFRGAVYSGTALTGLTCTIVGSVLYALDRLYGAKPKLEQEKKTK